jgi:hypothetical protein
MTDSTDGSGSLPDCPECGEELSPHPSNIPTPLYCYKCEREYWQEGSDTWFSCGSDGVIARVE